MSKMSELHANGVTNLHDYNLGWVDGVEDLRQSLIKTIKGMLANKEALAIVPADITLRLVMNALISDLKTDENAE